jgi:hypothetical protein
MPQNETNGSHRHLAPAVGQLVQFQDLWMSSREPRSVDGYPSSLVLKGFIKLARDSAARC